MWTFLLLVEDHIFQNGHNSNSDPTHSSYYATLTPYPLGPGGLIPGADMELCDFWAVVIKGNTGDNWSSWDFLWELGNQAMKKKSLRRGAMVGFVGDSSSWGPTVGTNLETRACLKVITVLAPLVKLPLIHCVQQGWAALVASPCPNADLWAKQPKGIVLN